MTLQVVVAPFTSNHPEFPQQFQTGDISLSFEATMALGGGCGHALWAMMTAHVSNQKLGSMTDELHRLNTLAIDGDGDDVITIGRIGSGDMFQITTTNIHSEPKTTIDLVTA